MSNLIDAQHAPIVTCYECGASTWMPLRGWPPGWGEDGGLIYCNLHLGGPAIRGCRAGESL